MAAVEHHRATHSQSREQQTCSTEAAGGGLFERRGGLGLGAEPPVSGGGGARGLRGRGRFGAGGGGTLAGR